MSKSMTPSLPTTFLIWLGASFGRLRSCVALIASTNSFDPCLLYLYLFENGSTQIWLSIGQQSSGLRLL